MNFIQFESEQKLRGGFYTEPAIASFLIRWIKASKPRSLLEPSCGDGAFLDAIQRLRLSTLKLTTAFELDPVEAEKARNRTQLPLRLFNADFLAWYLLHSQGEESFDAVVGNPPFVRYQYLSKNQQLLAEKIFSQLRLPFTKHTNAWVPFVLASIKLLRPGGRVAMVIPSEIFHIPHAQSLRRYLAAQCSRILLFDPEEIWFNNTLQGTVLLLAEKKQNPTDAGKGVAIIPVKTRQTLSEDAERLFQDASYTNGVTIEGKWMPVFLTLKERTLIAQLKSRDDIKVFSQIASVDVGIVTGANNFFLVSDEVVSQFALERWAHPMFGRSDHVQGLVYTAKDHEKNKRSGLPANFLWFRDERIEDLPASVREYLDTGLTQKLHTRFKCRMRKPWYLVPSVYSSPVAMLKRAHHYPRLVLNSADAYTTDTAYRIRPLGIKPEALVLAFVNSLTCLTAELEGRHYGGGVLELVPSEIERLLVPVIKGTTTELQVADRKFRGSTDDSAFLRIQDRLILGRIRLTTGERESLNEAWARLRDRRHRIPSGDAGEAPLFDA